MTIREFRKGDQKAVEEIFASYWTDPEFLEELSGELHSYLKRTSKEDLCFFVAEENSEILGIVGFRKSTNYLKLYARTNNPVEFYVIAVKYKGKGVGEKLKLKLTKEAQKFGFSEILLFSPNSHRESWGFYDKLEKRGSVKRGSGTLFRPPCWAHCGFKTKLFDHFCSPCICAERLPSYHRSSDTLFFLF